MTSEAARKNVLCVYEAMLLTSQAGLFCLELITFGRLNIYDEQLARSEKLAVGKVK
jgi:hypothetical protein